MQCFDIIRSISNLYDSFMQVFFNCDTKVIFDQYGGNGPPHTQNTSDNDINKNI